MYDRTIICLANSRKPPSGRCIAGKVIEGAQAGEWLRPVSSRESREVSEEERRYENGLRAQLLEIITIPLDRHEPLGHQVENHLLAEDHYWKKEGVATWNQVRERIDPYDANFWIQAENTSYGLNDKVIQANAALIRSSLKLIFIPELSLRVRFEPGFQGRPARKRVRAHFTYHGVQYLLSVTDPDMEEAYLQRNEGEYPIENAALCISLAEVWNGFAFRLVASIITANMCRG